MTVFRRLIVVAGLVLAVALVYALKPDPPAPAQPAASTAASPVEVPVTPPATTAGDVAGNGTAPPLADKGPARSDAVDRVSATNGPKTAAALPRLVDIGADKCIPCKAMAPILEQLRQEYAGRLRVDFIDAWKYPEQAAPFNVYGIPTQIFFDASGRELHRHVGFISKEDILATWKRLGFSLTPRQKGSRP